MRSLSETGGKESGSAESGEKVGREAEGGVGVPSAGQGKEVGPSSTGDVGVSSKTITSC